MKKATKSKLLEAGLKQQQKITDLDRHCEFELPKKQFQR